MTNKQQYKVAAVQAAPMFLDLEKSIDKAVKLIAEAAAQGASLIAFPEVWLPGYPWWIWTDAPASGMRFVKRHFENAMEVDGAPMQRLKRAAADNRIHLVMGYAERRAGSLYLSQAIIDDEGQLLANRRKLRPTHVERSVYGDGDGSDLVVIDTKLGRMGALNCAEHFQPLSKFAMFAQHEQIHVASWPSFSVYRGKSFQLSHQANNAASQVYAIEGQSFVVAPCAIVDETMIDALVDSPYKAELLQAGGGFAMIYGPDGSPLSDPLDEHQEGILYADVDLSLIANAKASLDPVGHYSRPDVLQLLINRSARTPMVEVEDDRLQARELATKEYVGTEVEAK